ncbi:MAG: hypothetical protein SGI74_12930 [Oligoflexia bacterium]|nr:hypothetical protein [Oligoflexia bacterium]
MSHKRAVIREFIVNALKGQTGAGQNVFGNRANPLWEIPLPAILVYAREEHSEPISVATSPLKRTLSLAIEVRCQASSNLDDALDDVALEIENVINTDPLLGGNVIESILNQTEIEISSEGEKPIGALRLTFEVVYQF